MKDQPCVNRSTTQSILSLGIPQQQDLTDSALNPTKNLDDHL
jgi:hypothetical protein